MVAGSCALAHVRSAIRACSGAMVGDVTQHTTTQGAQRGLPPRACGPVTTATAASRSQGVTQVGMHTWLNVLQL